MTRTSLWPVLFALLALLPLASGPAGASPGPELGHDPAGWLRADDRFELRVPAELGPVRIFLGTADVTDLFARRGTRLIYRPELVPLPTGETEIVVYRAGSWEELGRWPLRVLLRGGVEAAEASLRIDVEALSDLDSGGSTPPLEEERATSQVDFQLRAVRRATELRAGVNLLGVSEVEQALRFGEDGEDADRLDLSSFTLEIVRGRLELGLGHVFFGDSRHLVQGFASRGLRARLPLGKAVELRLGALNGTAIVGWDNLLGLDDGDHQILSGTLGVEAVPSRPGALRFEGTFLDGSVLPLAGFNEGEVTDAETSDGWTARILTASPSQRFRLDAAWSESRFVNPLDPLLSQGADLVEVEPATETARYADLTWAFLQRADKTGRLLELALDLRHQRAEPLYRSVAAFVQADLEENAGDLRLSWGGLSSQLSFGASRDNLDDVPSILTTKTRRGGLNVAVPFGQLGGAPQPSPWAPTLTWNSQRLHQYGVGIPVDGDFAASHVPDQVSWNHLLGLAWTGGRWTLGLNGSASEQDNRQPGRENADFETTGVGFNLFFTPVAALDLGVDVRREEQENVALAEDSTTLSTSLQWTLRLPARVLFTGSASWTDAETVGGADLLRRSENLIGNAQIAWSFEKRRRVHGVSGQVYLRGAFDDSENEDLQFGFADRRDGWKVTAGLNLGLY